MTQQPDREFFNRRAIDVARGLLGAYLTHTTADGQVTIRVTEVEAYQGSEDPGSHAFKGPSARNEVMFDEPGHLYTYRHLGLHTCVNIVCGPPGTAAAVLLRAGEVVAGHDLARARRRAAGTLNQDRDLARGPARLTVALDLTMSLLGADLLAPEVPLSLELAPEAAVGAVLSGPRVGVSGAGGDGETFPWRLWLVDEPTVSVYRPASPRRRARGQNGGGTSAKREKK